MLDMDRAAKLVGHYRYVFSGEAGEAVLNDLAFRAGITPDPDRMRSENALSHYAGDQLTHAECAYRNGTQDFFRYIEALVSQK